MSQTILNILDTADPLIALVGATDAPNKFGAIIYRDLKGKGYRVVPVNPGRETVDGDRCYPTLSVLPDRPDIVNIVVPPDRTETILSECKKLGWLNVWLQPGADNPAVLTYLDTHGFNYLASTCIMIKARGR